jgi:hypothetical protein
VTVVSALAASDSVATYASGNNGSAAYAMEGAADAADARERAPAIW